jgi:hypothetical protein
MFNTIHKKYTIVLICCFAVCICHAQKIELRGNLYSGWFSFRGDASTKLSRVHVTDVGYHNPTSYGRKSDFSWALEFQAQRISRRGHLFGAGVSLENLTSKAGIDSIQGDMPGAAPASGKVTIANTFLTLNPYIGQRFGSKNFVFEIQAGVDCAVSIQVIERAIITTDGYRDIKLTKKNHPLDLRPRIQFNAYYNQVGLLAGYSSGTQNLYDYDNPNYMHKKAYARFLRLGISYKLN